MKKNYTIEISKRKKEIEELKENFIKLVVSERLPLEHDQCVLRVPKERLEIMSRTELKVEYNPYINKVEFGIKF